MRQRTRSSVGVVIVGIVPAIMGGPIFAAIIALLCLVAFREYATMTTQLGARPSFTGYAAVLAFAAAALAGAREQAALGIVAAAVAAPLVIAIFQGDQTGAFRDWALAAAGSLYLGLPAFAAVAIRRTDGDIDAGWLRDLADWSSLGWDAAPRGLSWLLVVIIATWLGDTFAYLVGRAVGRRPLIPKVSPKKTVEGLVGGLVGAAIAGAIAVSVFGLDVNPLLGLLIGLVLGVVGLIGDLAESLLKRQVGVKDSGNLIPGHGGMLDRLDALLFTWVAGWYLVTLVDKIN